MAWSSVFFFSKIYVPKNCSLPVVWPVMKCLESLLDVLIIPFCFSFRLCFLVCIRTLFYLSRVTSFSRTHRTICNLFINPNLSVVRGILTDLPPAGCSKEPCGGLSERDSKETIRDISELPPKFLTKSKDTWWKKKWSNLSSLMEKNVLNIFSISSQQQK